MLLKDSAIGMVVPGSAGRSSGSRSRTIDGPEIPKTLKNRSAPVPFAHVPVFASYNRASPFAYPLTVFIAHS